MSRIGHSLALSALLLCTCLIFASGGHAQENASRKRVGLVLSGGSAHGFAHLGVLKWMEEHHVPVDYIAGTSMGSLMGGFYATGMNVPEMEAELSEIDWEDLFRSTIPHRLRTFRRKEDAREMQNNLEFGRGLTTQTGLDSVYPVSLLLSRLTLPYPDDISFDDLPIPFRCTAVELNTAKIIRFSAGSLGQAMRSSMAIPLVFTTVDEYGRSYVDGGVLENLPAATMVPGPDRPDSWRPDAVVTVRLEQETNKATRTTSDETAPQFTTGDKNQTTPSNLFDVIGRLIAAVTGENMRRSLALLDNTPGLTHIPLTARIKEFTSEDFSRWREIMAFGYAAAEQNAAKFQPFQVNDAEWNAYIAAKEQRRRRSMTPVIVTVVPQDPSRKFDPRLNTYLLTRLRKYAGRTLLFPQTVPSDPPPAH